MEHRKPSTPQKRAGTQLRELAKKRREKLKPTSELIEILKTPSVKDEEKNKKSAIPQKDQDLEI